MCVVLVYGVPTWTRKKIKKILVESLVEVVLGVEALDLRSGGHAIPCHLVLNSLFQPQASNITVVVIGLFDHHTRTDKVRELLAQRLTNKVRDIFPKSNLIQCQVHPFDPKWGFAHSLRAG